jgi:ATP-dependent exoDNAse (exonuclease V) alpha subunit
MIATGSKIGKIALIPKIKFNYSATGSQVPIDFRRIQFPIRLAFAMTINKAQGQTLDSIGLYLPNHVFSHGHLYVALSRVKSPKSLKIMIDTNISKIENVEGAYTSNIVYTEVFRA